MRSTLIGCRNHLLFFIGKGAKAKRCSLFSMIKRQWEFSYILTKKGMSRASSDVGFMFIAYNLKRIGNILTRDQLREYLRILFLLFLSKTALPRLQNSLFRTTFFRMPVMKYKFSGLLIPA